MRAITTFLIMMGNWDEKDRRIEQNHYVLKVSSCAVGVVGTCVVVLTNWHGAS